MIDSSSISGPQHAANTQKKAIDPLHGSLAVGLTRIHALVDASGLPIALCNPQDHL
jgi:hypothetical protein